MPPQYSTVHTFATWKDTIFIWIVMCGICASPVQWQKDHSQADYWNKPQQRMRIRQREWLWRIIIIAITYSMCAIHPYEWKDCTCEYNDDKISRNKFMHLDLPIFRNNAYWTKSQYLICYPTNLWLTSGHIIGFWRNELSNFSIIPILIDKINEAKVRS